MSAAKIGLLVGGAAFEFLGIIVIVFPDLIPYGIRLSLWQRRHTRALFDHIGRLLGRPRNVVIEVPTASELNIAGRGSPMKSASGAATLEQKVEFLLTRDQEAQRDVNMLRERIEDLGSNRRNALTNCGVKSRCASRRN
jgi:hypothetical protein